MGEIDRLKVLAVVPIPVDEYLRVELEGAKAYRENPPFSGSISIPRPDAPRISLGARHEHRPLYPDVAPQSVWWHGWDDAAQDAAVTNNASTKGMWRR